MIAGSTKDNGYGRATGTMTSTLTAMPVRPKHIDQYVHLLPESTQKKAATVKGLLRDLDVAREKMRLLMDDPKASDDSRAQWAKTATTLDGKVKAIYKELDAEWEKLVKSGRVTVDAFGNASVTVGEPTGTVAATDETAADKKQDEKEAENQRKASLLRKFLIDKRNAKSEKQTEKWLQKYHEMVALGGEESVTDKVREAAEYYGISLDDITV